MFFSLFLSFTEKEYQTESNWLPIFDDFLWTKRSPRSKRVGPEESRAIHEGGGALTALGMGPYLMADSETPLMWDRR